MYRLIRTGSRLTVLGEVFFAVVGWLDSHWYSLSARVLWLAAWTFSGMPDKAKRRRMLIIPLR
jgi:hypothetical protein